MIGNEMHGAKDDFAIEEVARAWFIKLRGENAESMRGEFDRWLSASSRHKRAYDRVANNFAEARVLKRSKRFGAQASPRQSSFLARHRLSLGVTTAMAALVVLAFGSGGSLLPSYLQGNQMAAHAAEPLTTRRGEIRSFRLADGSTVTLDTDSRAEVSMTDGERHLRLLRGRARLNVVRDARPFRIEAGTGIVTAKEALVDIGYADKRRIVMQLIGGKAELAPMAQPSSDEPPVRSLPGGKAVAFSTDGGPLRTLAPAPPLASQDWPSGWTQHRAIRLDHLVAEANRYATKLVILDSQATARLEASGRFKVSDTDMFVGRIADLFDLAVDKRDDGIHLRRK